MRVLEDRQHRPARGQQLELAQQHRHDPLAPLGRGQLQLGIAVAGRDRQQIGEQRRVLGFLGTMHHHALELGQSAFRAVVAGEARDPLDLGDEGMERRALLVLRAEIAQPDRRLRFDLVQQHGRQARLADARLARQQHHLPRAALRLAPQIDQPLGLVVSAEQRIDAGLALRLEPAVGGARTQDLPDRHRRLEALERDRPEIAIVEKTAGQLARRRVDDHGVWLRQALQPRRQIGRAARDRLLCRAVGAHDGADDDQAGRDADPDPGRIAAHRAQPRHRLDHAEGGVERAFGIVFMGFGIAEIDHRAVAREMREIAAERADHVGHAAQAGADNLAGVLGVEPRRQGRRIRPGRRT